MTYQNVRIYVSARHTDVLDCPCGEYHNLSSSTRRFVRRVCENKGPTIDITTPDGTWAVPRIYIAAHGMTPVKLPVLAEQYKWAKVEKKQRGAADESADDR